MGWILMIECVGQVCGGSGGGARPGRAFLAEGTEYGTVCRHTASSRDGTTASTCLLMNYAWEGQCWVDRARAGKALMPRVMGWESHFLLYPECAEMLCCLDHVPLHLRSHWPAYTRFS